MSKTVARISKSVSRIRVVASGSSTTESSNQVLRPSRRPSGTTCDPDGVFAAGERTPVEPAVTGFDPEARALQQRAPLVRREPRESHRRFAGISANRQRQRPSLIVPVRAFEDAGLTLEPAV